jgi:hypothetical protein
MSVCVIHIFMGSTQSGGISSNSVVTPHLRVLVKVNELKLDCLNGQSNKFY